VFACVSVDSYIIKNVCICIGRFINYTGCLHVYRYVHILYRVFACVSVRFIYIHDVCMCIGKVHIYIYIYIGCFTNDTMLEHTECFLCAKNSVRGALGSSCVSVNFIYIQGFSLMTQ
jgi:hypothetical protein